jgi:hypothetical protein
MRRRCQGEIDASLSITFKDEAPRIASLRYLMGRTWSNHTSESNHSFTLTHLHQSASRCRVCRPLFGSSSPLQQTTRINHEMYLMKLLLGE